MDATRRITERGRPALVSSPQAKLNQTTEAVVSVSEDRSVTGEKKDQVGGVSADRKASLGRFKELLSGRSLPTMTQLMSAQNGEESAARKALEKPNLSSADTKSSEATSTSESTEESARAKPSAEGEESKEKSASGKPLTKEETQEVEKLKQRDREVRQHEQAHVAAGGQYVRGGIKYDFQRGPDGQSYAVGGHVNIDVSEAETPQATIVKMQQVKRAALAPAEPSGADRSVAAAAAQKEQQARTELLEERQEEVKESQSKVREHGESSRSDDSVKTDSSEVTDHSSSQVASSSSSSIEPPDAPKTRNHMNLAREARMRIKRGESWMA
jgi:hypothetical protein